MFWTNSCVYGIVKSQLQLKMEREVREGKSCIVLCYYQGMEILWNIHVDFRRPLCSTKEDTGSSLWYIATVGLWEYVSLSNCAASRKAKFQFSGILPLLDYRSMSRWATVQRQGSHRLKFLLYFHCATMGVLLTGPL